MLFSGIEVPKVIDLDAMSMLQVENMASVHQELVETYIDESVGLVALWGSTISELNFRAGIMQGLAEPEAEYFDIIDVPKLVPDDFLCSNVHGPLEDNKFQVTENELREVFGTTPFPIRNKYRKGLQTASGYYDRPITRLIEFAIPLRNTILTAQLNGLIYTFGDNDGKFYDQMISTNPKRI